MDIQEKLDAMRGEVFGKQVILRDIYREHGNKNIAEYVRACKIPSLTSVKAVTSKFFTALEKILANVYGEETARGALAQLKKEPLVSTIDHHGVLNHPFFINSNLFYSLKKTPYLVCLPSAGVSLNNNTSWSACLLVTGNKGQLQRFSFFPDRQKTLTAWSAPAFGSGNVERVHAAIGRSSFSEQTKTDMLALLLQFTAGGALKLKNFSLQAQTLSTNLWSLIFPSAPKLLYVPIEDLAGQAIDDSFGDSGALLTKLLCGPESWQLAEKYFLGSPGAFSGNQKGSFLFWGVGPTGRRVSLRREGSKLVGKNFSVELNTRTIGQALAQRQVYPTSLVCFMVLLLGGLTCLGGFNQVDWLTGIKEKLVSMLGELGEVDAATNLMKAETKNFAEGNLAFLPQGEKIIKPTGVDIYLQKNSGLYKKFQELGNAVTLKESIDSILPGIYRAITPSARQKPELLELTDDIIIFHNGVAEKVKVSSTFNLL